MNNKSILLYQILKLKKMLLENLYSDKFLVLKLKSYLKLYLLYLNTKHNIKSIK